MGESSTGFEAWRQALADTLLLAREIGCQPPVVDTLAAMIGDAQPQDWHDNGPYWLHMASDAPWNKAAAAAVAAVPPADLARLVTRVFMAHQRLEELRATNLELVLLRRAAPAGSKAPSYQRAAWGYVGWASAIVTKAALRRKPALDDETAMLALSALTRALLHWVADHVSEPDLPMKELLAWVATHRFTLRERAALMVERIGHIIGLVPVGDAQDRKVAQHLTQSVEALRTQLAEPVAPRGDALAPREQPYPAASFHRDWDALVKDEMKRLGFTRIKGGPSRWIKPVGERWLHVGFFPSKWGWASYSGGSFHVGVELSAARDPAAVDARETLHLFATYTEAEYAPLLARTAAARAVVRRLAFADEFTRQLHETAVAQSNRYGLQRAAGEGHPDFEFYDPAELVAWAQALLPTLGDHLDKAVAAAH